MQYWDDLDDLMGVFGLISEKIRGLFLLFLCVCVSLLLLAGGAWLALQHPPLALATVILLVVTLLYHMATSPHPLK